MEKLKVSIVSYLNSKPLLYGLENSDIKNDIDITLDIPSKIAYKLKNNLTNIGLVPVAAIKEIKEPLIISDYCIGSYKAVKTVALFSEVPLSEIKDVYLDFHSRSSVMLAQVLAKFYWKQEFNWLSAEKGFEKSKIKDTTAGVVIGDRVFEIENKYPYLYDLSLEWYNFTRLPFVFAAWVSNTKLDNRFIDDFNSALQYGVNSIDKVVTQELEGYPNVDVASYLKSNIDFNFNDDKKLALSKFLEFIKQL